MDFDEAKEELRQNCFRTYKRFDVIGCAYCDHYSKCCDESGHHFITVSPGGPLDRTWNNPEDDIWDDFVSEWDDENDREQQGKGTGSR